MLIALFFSNKLECTLFYSSNQNGRQSKPKAVDDVPLKFWSNFVCSKMRWNKKNAEEKQQRSSSTGNENTSFIYSNSNSNVMPHVVRQRQYGFLRYCVHWRQL